MFRLGFVLLFFFSMQLYVVCNGVQTQLQLQYQHLVAFRVGIGQTIATQSWLNPAGASLADRWKRISDKQFWGSRLVKTALLLAAWWKEDLKYRALCWFYFSSVSFITWAGVATGSMYRLDLLVAYYKQDTAIPHLHVSNCYPSRQWVIIPRNSLNKRPRRPNATIVL